MAKMPPGEGGERGVIVNTASVAAFDGQIGQAAYSASKGRGGGDDVAGGARTGALGIRVMTIAPGIFKTPMMAGMTQEVQDSLGASVPFPPRLGEPAGIRGPVRHIVEKPDAEWRVIRLDGAIRMAPK